MVGNGRSPYLMETLGDLTGTHYEIWAWCPNCMRGRTLDPHALVRSHGADFPFMRLKSVLTCTNCGRKGCVAHFSRSSRPIW